jgi:hypothetical protein
VILSLLLGFLQHLDMWHITDALEVHDASVMMRYTTVCVIQSTEDNYIQATR